MSIKKNLGFKVVREGCDVSIVRVNATHGASAHSIQKMKVMCFDSAQVDRIFSIQEKSSKVSLHK